jgi:hypothetical protein
MLPFLEHIRYCEIATKIQDSAARSPLLNYQVREKHENELVDWYKNLPPLLGTFEPCPEPLASVRNIMRWRYILQRMSLYRPVLLTYAIRRAPYADLLEEDRSSIEKCIMLAGRVIKDISSSALRCPNQLCGWNAARILFEAVMIPLLALFIQGKSNLGIISNMDPYSSQVETAITALASLHAWSPTAPQMLSYVWRIYGAINHLSSPHVPSDLHMINSAMPFLFAQSLREEHGIDPDIDTVHDPDVAAWMRHDQRGEKMDLSDPGSMFQYLPDSTYFDEGLAWLTELSMYSSSIEVEIPCRNMER